MNKRPSIKPSSFVSVSTGENSSLSSGDRKKSAKKSCHFSNKADDVVEASRKHSRLYKEDEEEIAMQVKIF